MEGINILNKRGFLTPEDRKHKCSHRGEYFTFETNLDLSIPIKVTPFISNEGKFNVNQYSVDLAIFMEWWSREVWKDLNGFSGFHNVKFELVGFELV
jgi:hypothetical protein